jgi:hypothetical protein
VPRLVQGASWEGDDPEDRAAAVEAAFDYRGDVTIILREGGEVKGYVSNRDAVAAEPFLVVHPSDGSPPRRIPYAHLRGIAFTGRDTAAGKSWETWVKKHRARLEARARGEEVSPIGLFPEPLD